MPSSQPPTRRTVTSVSRYEDAEHAVDWLSDHDFPVEHVSIIGTDLRFVEQVDGRQTTGRASLLGVGYGALFGLFWGHGLVRLSDLRWRRLDLRRLRDIRVSTLGRPLGRFVVRFFGIFA